MRRIEGGEVREAAVGGGVDTRVELQLLDDIGRPGFGKAFKGEDIHRAGAEEGPDGQLDRAGVGAGDDTEFPIGRHAEDGAGTIDHLGKAGLGEGCAMTTAERSAIEGFERPARPLGARPGGEAWIGGTPSGF